MGGGWLRPACRRVASSNSVGPSYRGRDAIRLAASDIISSSPSSLLFPLPLQTTSGRPPTAGILLLNHTVHSRAGTIPACNPNLELCLLPTISAYVEPKPGLAWTYQQLLSPTEGRPTNARGSPC